MKGSSKSNRYVLAVLAMLALGSSERAYADLVTISSAPTLVDGNDNGGFPLNISYFLKTSMRYQQVFDARSLGGMPTQAEIIAVAFRVDAQVGSVFDTTLANIRVDLSTTTRRADGLDTLFSLNTGSDNRTVFSGQLHLSSTALMAANGTMPFDVVIHFTTPFLYTGNNLLLDIYNFGGGFATQLDAVSSLTDGVSRVYSADASSTNAPFRDSSGLIAQFQLRTVNAPLPGALWLIVVPMTYLGRTSRRR